MKRNTTSSAKKKITELAHKYMRGEIELETFINETLKEGKQVWEAIKFETQKKFGGYLSEEDIDATMLEAITTACIKCTNAEKFFAYARQTLKGMLKRLASTLAFANVVSKPDTALEKVSLESMFTEEDDEGNHSPADIREPSEFVDENAENEFYMLELKDFVRKKLPPLQQRVFWAAWEGDSPAEIAKSLGLPPQEVEKMLHEIRKVLQEFIS